jgi:NAD(P)-dependent dehydrogenase (short-subunit alcohol dehydrogenase family)
MKTTPADWDQALARNFEQATYAAQAAARKLIAQNNGGRIIFLSSIAALEPLARTSAVGTSLSALHVLARMAAVDLGPHRITANVVAVGWTEADLATEFLTPDGRAYVQQGIPTGRVGTPADVADVCSFLASDQAAYVTGAIIPVDGGFTLTKMDGLLGAPGDLKWS